MVREDHAATGSASAAAPMLQANKDMSIETLRGLAIVFVVIAHVIGTDAATGMRVADDSWYRYLYYCTQYLLMPLFVALSGYLYARRPVEPGRLTRFLHNKFWRLFVPFVIAATLQYVVRAQAAGVNEPLAMSNIWTIYLWPFDQFWFIQALLGIFLIVAVLDYFQLMRHPAALFAVLVAATAYAIHPLWVAAFFSINNVFYLLPFFLFGCALRRHPDMLLSRTAGAAYAAISIVGYSLQQYAWFAGAELPMREVGMAVGFSGIGLLVYLRPRATWLAWIGSFAFGIYLYHVFGTAGTRIMLERIGLDADPLIFAAGLVVGVALPIAFELVVRRSPLAQQFVLGVRPKRDRPATPATSTTQPQPQQPDVGTAAPNR